MRRSGFLTLLFLGVVIALSGCGNAKNETAVSIIETNEPETEMATLIETIEETEPAEETIAVSENKEEQGYNIRDGYSFSEGLAWVKFEINGSPYFGCIDINGELQFYFEGDPNIIENFEEGYAYFTMDKYTPNCKRFTVDKLGNTYLEPVDEPVLAYGAGYRFVSHYESDFNGAKYTYSVKSVDGDEGLMYIHEGTQSPFKMNDAVPIYNDVFYLGEGIFVNKRDDWAYLGLTKQRRIASCPENRVFDMVDGFACTFIEKDMFGYIDKDGEYIKINFPEDYVENGRRTTLLANSNGAFLFANFERKKIFVYDIKTGRFSDYCGAYVDFINWEWNPVDGNTPCMVNDSIAIPLKGADNLNYFVITDIEMNDLTEPIHGKEFSTIGNYIVHYQYTGRKQYERNIIFYDSQGKEYATIFDENIKSFGDDMFVQSDGDAARYLKYDGTPVIEKIVDSKHNLITDYITIE